MLVVSVAVIVKVCALLSGPNRNGLVAASNVTVPFAIASGLGKMAVPSELVMEMVSVMPPTGLKLESTASTVTFSSAYEPPVLMAVGVPE